MPLNLAGYTTIKPIAVAQDRTATFYGTIVDTTGYRSLSILQGIDAVTGASHTKTGAVKYGSFTNLGTYDNTAAGDTWIPLRNSGTDNVKIAHAFTPASGSTPTFYSVRIFLYQAGTVAANKHIWVTMEGDAPTDPDDTPFWTSYKIAANGVTTSTSGEWVTFYFRDSAVGALTASTQYHVVLQGDYTASTTNHIKAYVTTVTSGGTISLYDAAWGQVATQTLKTDCSVVASWTTITANAFTAVATTNPIEDVEATAVQEQVVDCKQYGPAIRYECVGAGTQTTALCYAVGVLGDPKSPA
jgi:hypothetical protein